MSTATLVRRPTGAAIRAREYHETFAEPEILFEGEIAEAIEAARAIPTAERVDVSIETETAYFGPDDFDTMTPDRAPLRDLDVSHRVGIIRIEKGAMERLYDPAQGLIPAARIFRDNAETVTAIMNHKLAIGEAEEEGGRRLIRITAADIEAA